MALTTVYSGGIKDDSIVNVDIKSDAAIEASKLDNPLQFPDDHKISFGTDNAGDLEIYHSGGNSFIHDGGAGGLYIRGSILGWRDAGNSNASWINTNSGAGVELYYAGNNKLETTSSGITVRHTAATAVTIVGANNTDSGIYFNDGANQGGVIYQHNGDYMSFRTAGSDDRLRIDSSGNVGINTTPSNILHVSSGNDNICALFESTDAEAQVRIKDTTGTAILACKNDFSFENSTTGSLARITAAGDFSIGTTSPAMPLDVRKDNSTSGRLACFGTNGTPNTAECSGVTNALTIARARISVPANTTINLVGGYGGSMVLVTLVPDSGVADVQMTFMMSHGWSVATQLFYNTYGANAPTVTWSASSGHLQISHNHSGTILVNVATLIATAPTTG